MKMKLLSAVATAVMLCTAAPIVLAQNVAIVNGKAVPKSRLEALAQQAARSGRPVTPEMEGQLREAVIAREVFFQEAQRQGLDTTEDFKTQIELARQTILINELFTNFQKNSAVTDADAKAEYDKLLATNGGKEYKARHILVEKEDEAKALIAQLKKGAKFEDLAKKSSKDTGSGANGGDLDWVAPANFVPEFSAAMTKLAKGKITETPVKTQFGYHVIRLDDTRETQFPKFEEVKTQVAQKLMQQKVAKYQEDLRAKAKVE